MVPVQFPKTFFTFSQYWWLYALFVGFVLIVLLLDLGVFHKKDSIMSSKEALLWSVFWILLAIGFNALFYFYSKGKSLDWFTVNPAGVPVGKTVMEAASSQATDFGTQFITGYILEKVLAIDNIFVFVMIFKFFSVPLKFQHKVLFYGILGAIFFRAIFISIGAALIQFEWVLIAFGVFLILTGIKIIVLPDHEIEPDKNWIVRLLRKTGRVSTKGFEETEGKFFTRENGKLFFTTLFIATVLIELSDIVFALDSVPAIFGVTKEPFIVFTSNIFAILGLRSLYFLLANMVEKFKYLKYGVSIILIFVGVKMVYLNHLFDGKFPISYSLSFIFIVIVISMIPSFFIGKKAE